MSYYSMYPEDRMSGSSIAGIVVGALLGVALLAAVICMLMRSKQASQAKDVTVQKPAARMGHRGSVA